MVVTAVAINDVLATRLYLDGQWSLDEFELLFRSFNDLYRLIAEFTVKAGSVKTGDNLIYQVMEDITDEMFVVSIIPNQVILPPLP
jgi:hypothetical protein